MIKNNDIRTTPKQRIIIAAIAVFMLASTFALYAGIVLNAKNAASSDERVATTQEEEDRFNELYAEYQAQVDAQADELSNKYFGTFSQYKSRVKAFNQADVNEIKTNDLKVGTGATVTDSEFIDYAAYYIGWLKDGTIFDSSLDDDTNPTKLEVPLVGNANMIEGWKQGIVGMKIGGIREISIPSALAYGDTDNGTIPANSALKFVVMLIDPIEEIPVSDELNHLYNKVILGVDE